MKKLMLTMIAGMMVLSGACFGMEGEKPRITDCLVIAVPPLGPNPTYASLQTFYSKNSDGKYDLAATLRYYKGYKGSPMETVTLSNCREYEEILKEKLRNAPSHIFMEGDKQRRDNLLNDMPGVYDFDPIKFCLGLSGCGVESVIVHTIAITGEPEELLESQEITTVSIKNDEIVLDWFGECAIYDTAHRTQLLKALEDAVPFGLTFKRGNYTVSLKVKGYQKNSRIWLRYGILPYWKWKKENISFSKPPSGDVQYVKIDTKTNEDARFGYQIRKYLTFFSIVAVLAGIGYFLKTRSAT